MDESALSPGDRLGNYTIVSLLGGGGMGQVYLAQHHHLGRSAAIKVLHPHLAVNRGAVARFFNEARAVGRIRHPGIVDVLDYDQDRTTGRAFIVMEYLEGRSLETALRERGALSVDEAAALGAQIARAVAAAHQQDIVHRDLKPDNIFLPRGAGATEPRVKVLDFGVAKLTDPGADESTRTQTGAVIGTPLYMSPEQCQGRRGGVDHRTDIYALGCILFRMATGRLPFEEEGAGELLVAHITRPPPTVASLRPDAPAWLNALIGRMLEKDPAARPQTMAEVASALEARPLTAGATLLLQDGSPPPLASPVLSATRTPADLRASTTLSQAAIATVRTGRGVGKREAWAALVTAALLLGGGALVLNRSGEKRPEATVAGPAAARQPAVAPTPTRPPPPPPLPVQPELAAEPAQQAPRPKAQKPRRRRGEKARYAPMKDDGGPYRPVGD